MDWTLTHASTTQTFEAWGLGSLRISSRSLEPSVASFTHQGAAIDSELLFEYGDAITIQRDGVTVFTGKVSRTPRMGQGPNESISYEVSDAIWDLSRTTYQQAWNIGSVSTKISTVLLFDKGDKSSATVAEALTAVIAHAVYCGISIQLGTLTGMSHTPAKVELRDVTLLEAIRAILRYAPDAVSSIDHSTTPPTLNLTRRADATGVTCALTDLSAFDIASREDIQVPAVVLLYLKSGEKAEKFPIAKFTDKYPAEATGLEPGALVATFDLRASETNRMTQEHEVVVAAVDASSKSWWQSVEPWISVLDAGDFTLTDTAQTSDNRLVSGQAPPWLPSSAEEAFASAVFSGNVNGQYVEAEPIYFRYTGTTLSSGTYKQPTTEDMADEEPGPTSGVAAQLYAAWSVLHWQGQAVFTTDEVAFNIKPGNVLNVSGGLTAWATMNAQVHGVDYDIDAGTKTVSFGPNERLGPQDFLAMLKLMRDQRPTVRSTERADGEAEVGKVLMPAYSANSSGSVGPKGGTRPPLQAYGHGNGEWSVTPGNVNGEPVTDASGDPLSDMPPARGTQSNGKIWLEIIYSLTFVDGYLKLPTTFVSAKVKAGSSVPANSHEEITEGTPGEWTFNIELATLTDGTPSGNTFGSSMTYEIEDASDDDTPDIHLRGFRA